MLAWEDGHGLLGHIVALLKQVLVYHGEALLEELAVLVAYIKVEVRGVLLARLKDYGVGNYVSGSKLQTLVIVVHEALLVAVQQVSSLAADSLGNEEALSGSAVVEGCGVELNIAQVLYLCAHFVGKGYAVACCDGGVSCELVYTSDTACCHYHEVAVAGLIGVISQLEQCGVACLCLLYAAHHGVLHDSDVAELLYILQKCGGYLLARSVCVVENTVVAVTALKGAVVCTVGVLVKVNSQLDYMLDVLCSLADKSVDSLNVVLEASCDEGIVLVVLDIVRGRVVHSCDTALSKGRIAQRQVSLADDEYIELLGKIDSCIESCGSAACYNNIIIFRHDKDRPLQKDLYTYIISYNFLNSKIR